MGTTYKKGGVRELKLSLQLCPYFKNRDAVSYFCSEKNNDR